MDIRRDSLDLHQRESPCRRFRARLRCRRFVANRSLVVVEVAFGIAHGLDHSFARATVLAYEPDDSFGQVAISLLRVRSRACRLQGAVRRSRRRYVCAICCRPRNMAIGSNRTTREVRKKRRRAGADLCATPDPGISVPTRYVFADKSRRFLHRAAVSRFRKRVVVVFRVRCRAISPRLTAPAKVGERNQQEGYTSKGSSSHEGLGVRQLRPCIVRRKVVRRPDRSGNSQCNRDAEPDHGLQESRPR